MRECVRALLLIVARLSLSQRRTDSAELLRSVVRRRRALGGGWASSRSHRVSPGTYLCNLGNCRRVWGEARGGPFRVGGSRFGAVLKGSHYGRSCASSQRLRLSRSPIRSEKGRAARARSCLMAAATPQRSWRLGGGSERRFLLLLPFSQFVVRPDWARQPLRSQQSSFWARIEIDREAPESVFCLSSAVAPALESAAWRCFFRSGLLLAARGRHYSRGCC